MLNFALLGGAAVLILRSSWILLLCRRRSRGSPLVFGILMPSDTAAEGTKDAVMRYVTSDRASDAAADAANGSRWGVPA